MSRGRGRRAGVWGVDSLEGPEDKPTLGRRELGEEGASGIGRAKVCGKWAWST